MGTLVGEGECRVFMSMPTTKKVSVWLGDMREALLISAEEELGQMGESARQVEGLFESLLVESVE